MSETIVPFGDVRCIHEPIAEELREATNRVLQRGWFVLGEEVASFERELAAYLGVGHAVGVANGTDAITLMLMARGIGAGDEVIYPANTCPATVTGIARSGASPVPADVDAETMLLDADSVAERITDRTRAVVMVHLYGAPVDPEPIRTALGGRNIALFEDAAQAHGSAWQGRRCGGLGDAAAFSFYPSKNLGACGDGGAVATDDPEVAKRVRMLRNYGETERYQCATPGMNSRLDEMQAALLRVKLRYLDAWNAGRARLAERYVDGLDELPLTLPNLVEGGVSNHHLFVIRSIERENIRKALAAQGISTQAHYPVAGHLHPAYASSRFPAGCCPVAERLCDEVLSLPLYAGMPVEHVDRVVGALRDYFEKS